MPFLTLNGVTVPVAKGGLYNTMLVGEQRPTRAFDGTLMVERRRRKRTWEFSTSPLEEGAAEALTAALRGVGSEFTYDTTANSSDGVAPLSTPAPSWQIEPSTAPADGAPIKVGAHFTGGTPFASAPMVKYGAGALLQTSPTTNLAVQNVRDGTEDTTTTGWNLLLGTPTLTSDTTYAYQGTRSLKAAFNAANTFITGSVSDTVGVGENYFGSCYVRGGGVGGVLAFTLYQPVTAAAATFRTWVSDDPTAWTRLVAGPLTTATTDPIHPMIGCPVGQTPGTFYIDAVQLEKQTNVPTAFVDGARAGATLQYDPSILRHFRDITVNFWTPGPYWHMATPAKQFDLLRFQRSGGANRFEIYSTSANEIRWGTIGLGGSSVNVHLSTDPWDSYLVASPSYHMVTVVMQHKPAAGRSKKELYVDGVLKVASSADDLPDFSALNDATILAIGNDGTGAATWDAPLDHLTLSPFAVDPATITAWYNRTDAPLGAPLLNAAGDFIPETSTTVLAEITGSEYVGVARGSVWQNNNRVITFRLEEF